MTECPQNTTLAIPTLLSWCAQYDIWIDPRLSVVLDDEHGGLRVLNNSTTPIDSHTTLVTIPKTAVLSARSCALADAIPTVLYGHGARLALSLALYGEMLLGECSRWHGYLQSLPKHTVPIALLWGIDEAWTDQGEEACEDARRAAALSAGTEIEKELLGDEGVSLLVRLPPPGVIFVCLRLHPGRIWCPPVTILVLLRKLQCMVALVLAGLDVIYIEFLIACLLSLLPNVHSPEDFPAL